jgi:apolipoprotein N-acyltransferase
MVRSLLFIFGVWLLFTVFVTVFAASANKKEVRNLPKWLWVLICVSVPFIGGLLYLALGRPLGGPKQRFRRTKSVAPDDDPAFLRDLASKLDTKDDEQPPKAPDSDSKETNPDDKPDEDSGPNPEPKDKS